MIGRKAECAALREVLNSARDGFSETLVLRGEAGIGKTALLEYAIETAGDFRLLRVTGIECEAELGFAALYQLVRPLLPDLPDLPEPQRAALESAFGLAAGPVPDRYLVALATLTLLSGAADHGPDGSALLVAVDDAQWLDQASAEALAFVARRLDADRVALVLTVREAVASHDSFGDLPSLRVPELTTGEALALIRNLAEGTIAPGVAGQIADRAAGNPLALVETARELTAEQLAGAALLPDPLPLGDDAQDRYWRKVAVLPPDQREFLLLAAADSSGDPELFAKAAASLGLDPGLARTAEVGELVTVADRVVFRHPLIRSAVYTGSPRRDRQRVHAAIADVSDPERDADRIAWHRAAAATEPDEDIAAQLEDAAGLARQRGGHAAAATFLHQAAELSPDPERRDDRLLAAARSELTAGRVSRAAELLDQAEPRLTDPRRTAQALQLRGEIQLTIGDGRQAPFNLLRAARAWAPLDPESSRNALLDAMMAQVYAGGREWTGTYADLRTVIPGDGAARSQAPDLVLDGFSALLSDGPGPAAPFLRRAVRAIINDELSDGQRMRWYTGGIMCASELLDFDAWRLLCDRFAGLCRDRGSLSILSAALDLLGTWQLTAGHLAAAEASNAEGREILAATGTPDRLGVRSVEVLLPAWRGEETALRDIAGKMIRDCARRGLRRVALCPHQSFVILGTGTRDYESALAHARVLLADNGPRLGVVVLPYAVEAAAACGDRETAELALSRLRARVEANRTDWGLGLLTRCEALAVRSAGRDGDAERGSLFADSVAHLERTPAISDLARTRLLYGEWLRRKRRRGQAREQLLAARDSFESMGANAFAQRARLELAATGTKMSAHPEGTPAHPDGTPEAKLTEREAQVARRVAAGATNAEVAAQLFISASTVDHHLRSVYRKLKVSSRTMLAVTFGDRL